MKPLGFEDTVLKGVSISGALFDTDDRYRYLLWRELSSSNHRAILFIGLNPSTADETKNDPTIRRCLGFAKRDGYGTCLMANLFAYRATDPALLLDVPWDPIGRRNDEVLLGSASQADLVVAAWGVHGALRGRAGDVLNAFRIAGIRLVCLGMTKHGLPRHPLYLDATTQFEAFL